MIFINREGPRFTIRTENYDPMSGIGHSLWTTVNWQEANEIQTKLSQMLLDFEIERGAYPVPDDEDYIAELHRTSDPF